MPKIGLVDDRADSRRSYKLMIELPIIKNKIVNWEVLDIAPLERIQDYPQWILENEISVLIIDEKLNESSGFNYLGHEVVSFLRNRFKILPIYGVTAWDRDSDLNKAYKDYNLIINKSDLEDRRDEFVNLFIRTGEDFYQKNQSKILRMSVISENIANGTADSKQLEELRSIQEYLMIPHFENELTTKNDWLNNLEEKINDFSKILDSLEKLKE